MGGTTWCEATDSYSEGRIDFAEFAERTRAERARWVGSVRRKLSPIPAWLGQEDSEQDFLVELFLRAKNFDPSLSDSGPYFRFGIHNVGKRVQKARGVEQHRRKSAARFELPTSLFEVDPGDDAVDGRRDPESAVARAQYYEVLRGLCETKAQLAVVRALEAGGGSLAGATARLYSDRDLRVDLRLDSEKRAVAVIVRVVDELIATYGLPEEEART